MSKIYQTIDILTQVAIVAGGSGDNIDQVIPALRIETAVRGANLIGRGLYGST